MCSLNRQKFYVHFIFLDADDLAAILFKTYAAFYLRLNLRNAPKTDKLGHFAKPLTVSFSYAPKMTIQQAEGDALPSDAQRYDRSLMRSSNIRNLAKK